MDTEEIDNLDLYAVLNVPRDATDEDVRKAYRNLSKVFHPDKHTTDDAKRLADQAFTKVQKAYEILSDPNKRDVYDLCGLEGVYAGVEVVPYKGGNTVLKDLDERKKKQAEERAAASTVHRGNYTCRINASDLQAVAEGKMPLFRAVVVQNSLDLSLGDTDAVTIQGQAALKNNAGAGNLIFGYRRLLSQHDTLDMSAVVGLRTLASITSTRQIDYYTQASVTGSWSLQDGFGLQVGSTRQMPGNTQGQFTWVLGPAGATGMGFAISKRGTKYFASFKIDVGAYTSISGRLHYALSESLSLRAIARLGFTGVDLELGAQKKWDALTSGYMGTVVGLQGVVVKVRASRSGQTFELPVLLSSDLQDWKLLAAAYVVPPLLYLAAARLVVKPVRAWAKRRFERTQQQKFAEQVREQMFQAAETQRLVAGVAKRRASVDGLIILEAVYGSEDTVQAYADSISPDQAQLELLSPPDQSDATVDSQEGSSNLTATSQTPQTADASSNTQSTGSDAHSTTSTDEVIKARFVSGKIKVAEAIQPILPVTLALQSQVKDGTLRIPEGVDKSNLMGFCNPAPNSADKKLYCAYYHSGSVYEVIVGEKEKLDIPGTGRPVLDSQKARVLLSRASVLGLDLLGIQAQPSIADATGAPGSSTQNFAIGQQTTPQGAHEIGSSLTSSTMNSNNTPQARDGITDAQPTPTADGNIQDNPLYDNSPRDGV